MIIRTVPYYLFYPPVQATPHALYYPWGRPGAGAPLRDEQGHPKVALHGTLLREQTNTQEHPLAGLGTRGDQTRLARREDVTAAHVGAKFLTTIRYITPSQYLSKLLFYL